MISLIHYKTKITDFCATKIYKEILNVKSNLYHFFGAEQREVGDYPRIDEYLLGKLREIAYFKPDYIPMPPVTPCRFPLDLYYCSKHVHFVYFAYLRNRSNKKQKLI